MTKTFDIAIGPWDKPSIESTHRRPVLRTVFVNNDLKEFIVHWQCMHKDDPKKWYSDGIYIPMATDAYEYALAVFNDRCQRVVKRGACSLAELEDLYG